MSSDASSDPLSFNTLVLQPVRRAITGQVVALFNDQARGEKAYRQAGRWTVRPGISRMACAW